MTINIKPVGTKILVSAIEKQEEKIGSILIPGTANAELSYGKIEAVSESISDVFEVGQTVLFPSGKGAVQYVGGLPYIWLDANPDLSEVWGIEQ
jgi:co-chaperonin GroES (HSP10)